MQNLVLTDRRRAENDDKMANMLRDKCVFWMNCEIKLVSNRCKLAVPYDDETYKAEKLMVNSYYFFSVLRQYEKLNTRKLPDCKAVINTN